MMLNKAGVCQRLISLAYEGDRNLTDYLVRLVRNPKPGSNFEKEQKKLIEDMASRGEDYRDNERFIKAHFRAGHNGLFFHEAGRLTGHVIWQEHCGIHGREWHIYHISVEKDLQRQGYGTLEALLALQYALHNRILFMELSTGGKEHVERMYRTALNADKELAAHYGFVPSQQENCLRLEHRWRTELRQTA